MKKIKIIAYVFCYLLFVNGCSTKKATIANYTYQSECLGVALDGSVTLKAWGNGRNIFVASEQAKKNAIRDVLFKGISAGSGECESRPLVTEGNAQRRYEDYFNRFFSDGGIYRDFVSLKDERISDKMSRKKIKTQHGVTYSVVVRVLRYELKEKLVADSILNK